MMVTTMHRIMLSVVLFLAFAAYGQKLVAIINTVDDEEPPVKNSELAHLTDRLREIAAKTLPQRSYAVMTQQSIQSLYASNDEMIRACNEAEGCLVKIGREIAADYIAQGRIGRFGKNYTIKVELYENEKGTLVSSFTGSAKDIYGLLSILDKEAPKAFKKIIPSAQEICEGTGNIWVGGVCKILAVLVDECEAKGRVWENNVCRAKTQREICESSGKVWEGGKCKAVPTISVSAEAGNVLTDSRDGKKYRIVKIGSQTWMAENLNYNASGSKCYDNKPENCAKYGRLYDWNTAMSACPSGWNLPSSAEWQTLVDFAGGEEIAGKKLKAKIGWNDFNGKSGNGTGEYGFWALPGGVKFPDRSFEYVGFGGVWWSSREYERNSNFAYLFDMNHDLDSVRRRNFYKAGLFSVRCVADGNVLTDARDGQEYGVVKIGSQTWMAENLNYNARGSKCYDNKQENCAKYGRLYDWNTAMNACPSGWHLPSYAEWETLVNFAGGKEIAGKKLKAKSDWNYNGNGTDDYGFSALPGGDVNSDDNFRLVGNNGFWWSSSEGGSDRAYYRYMSYNYEDVNLNNYNKTDVYSVRCVQDSESSNVSKVHSDRSSVSNASTSVSASVGNVLTDSRDGKKYKTVKIGSQMWMAENLNYNASGSKCYDNKADNCVYYGRLYDWNTAMSACPSGWHLPSNKEWQALVNFAGGDKVAGTKLKSKNGWNNYKGKSGNGTDNYGFSALPGGLGFSEGHFHDVGNESYWWSSDENEYDYDSSDAYLQYMLYYNEYAHWKSYGKTGLLSVRCLRD